MMSDDQWIITCIEKGDDRGIRAIIDQYGGLLKAVIYRHSKGYEAYHDECFNDVLWAVWTHIDQYDSDRSSFKNWLAAIARYKALNLVRDHAKEQWQEYCEEHGQVRSQAPDLKIILMEELNDFLKALKEEDRELFLDIFYRGMSVAGVADKCQISSQAVYQRISRGRKKMKEVENHDG